ncbi:MULTISPECIES: lipopolysaccharide kinase InaA family protein [unclassified Pseudomonas]|uniref:lipopolysaccharide kinase InaA family protein n=1 Tax=unclassified Pseudomonas TaxID=196821 RepID=UPI000871416C|nr:MULTISPECIES: lipopolysaccharide kinase InaA family protein [unclassified Pseudomonas]SCW35352.1 Lipopolysaccharide kinase (Kdo/WaaP) family protein [Pseudomonas sp. NFACC56-3]SFK16121.1 Lipopolysaccharide kinase (Kdo/WaaP) family protein [Pseudomonas sp. NFACC52]
MATSSAVGSFDKADMDLWLQMPGTWVEAPNLRRGGESGVQRVSTSEHQLYYRKQQVEHLYYDWRHPFGYPTAMREYNALLQARKLGVRVPRVVYAGCRKQNKRWLALLVTEALHGYTSLEDCYAQGEHERWGEPLHCEILRRYGSSLARLNAGRWQHGCLYLKHVFIRVDRRGIDIALIDMEKARQRISAKRAARHDLRQVKRRSSWTESQWQAFLQGYRSVFPTAVPE